MAQTQNMARQTERLWSEGAFVPLHGRLTQLVGTVLRARMDEFHVGEQCEIRDPISGQTSEAEVIGIDGDEALLLLLGSAQGISNRSQVTPLGSGSMLEVSDAYLGRVLGPMGNPIDGEAPLPSAPGRPITAPPPNPMTRPPISDVFLTGVTPIDALLTCGVGQRVGIFGSAGTGKSTLLVDLLRRSQADVVVIALVGERGREVRELVNEVRSEDAFARTVMVVSTSDSPPLERLRAADSATTSAEYFRDKGKDVLLIVDSLTRVARAQREVGLAAGEPPTRRGFPPSVFAMLPALLERSGRSDSGSITAFYTVLVEGDDDDQDPIADEVRSLLDGHILLSRSLAAQGKFPAIDIAGSVSRLMQTIASPHHIAAARIIRAQLQAIKEVELLVRVGEYTPGRDQLTDAALANQETLNNFLYRSKQPAKDVNTLVKKLMSTAGLGK
ncbi:FliI/YscN family ATPase [Flavimaricola sp.]|nr:FliI/YscN family ATPase [Flavimaricola sp.]